MALTLGQSHASTHKSLQYLNATRAEIEKSQLRLASGRKIVSPGDDVGGLAVSMKLEHQLTTTNALASNVANANSYAEMQYTIAESAYNILAEMSELQSKYGNASDTDKAVYQSTYDDLAGQLVNLSAETVNGEPLFNNSFSVSTTLTGENSVNMDAIEFGKGEYSDKAINLDELLKFTSSENGMGHEINLADNLADDPNYITTINDHFGYESGDPDYKTADDKLSLDDFLSKYIDRASSFKVQAAADQSTLGFASDYLTNMATSLESAHGRIMDVDVAEETINLSKLQVQQEAALAAIVQANLAMESVLKLLISRNE
jgi:flagellin